MFSLRQDVGFLYGLSCLHLADLQIYPFSTPIMTQFCHFRFLRSDIVDELFYSLSQKIQCPNP
jgi:hypothetical protein